MQANVDQRANPRIHAKVPVVVDGRDANHKPFAEESYTILVNESGALIALAAQLQLQDRVRITNKSTGDSADCRIAWRSAEPMQGRWSYGVALLDCPANFWALQK